MADLSFLLPLQKPVAILGCGVSGSAVAAACEQAGVPYAVYDERAGKGKDFSGHLQDYAFLVPSAGIPPAHPLIVEAVNKNIPLRSDVDLLLQSAPQATVVAVTGTNGKSTTVALIGHILQQAGKNVATGGNIGQAACNLPTLGADGIYVLEMSSYMLYYTDNPVADVAVYLNMTPDHLEWHGSTDHYRQSKERIFRQRTGRAPQVRIYGTSLQNEEQRDKALDIPEHLFLQGAHNRENLLAAYEACRACGLDHDTILRHMAGFEGLPHRQKQVAVHAGIRFINDSKATNPDAAATALARYDNIYWIAGGLPTEQFLQGLEPYYPKIRKAYLVGTAQDAFAAALDGIVANRKSGTIAQAVRHAYDDAYEDARAHSGNGQAVILLSPACKSMDQYRNFEERGTDFEACVHQLLQQENAR